jgi:hypothetical protein
METNTDAPCDGCTYATRRAAETCSTIVCVCKREYPPPQHVFAVLAPLLVERRPLDEDERAAEAAAAVGLCPPVPARARRPLTDAGLRLLVAALAPLAEINSIAGLRARYRDPREKPGTGGEQRDAAAALDAASDRGQITAARVSFARYLHLSTDARMTAWWLAQRGGAVRSGATVGLAAWADVYGYLDGPRVLAECAERATVLASAAEAKLRGLKHRAATGRFSETLAREIDDACSAESQARSMRDASRKELRAWALGRFEALWDEWRGA